MKSNPFKKWRSVRQFAKECGVSPQAIRDAIKANKIEAWPVADGEFFLIHRDQVTIFEKTRKRKVSVVSPGRYHFESQPARGRRPGSRKEDKSVNIDPPTTSVPT